MQQMVSLLQILLLAQHVSGTTMPIIRSSGVLYRRLLSVVFRAVVFKLLVWYGAVGSVSGLLGAALKYASKPVPVFNTNLSYINRPNCQKEGRAVA